MNLEPFEENWMDLRNNAVGVKAALRKKPVDPDELQTDPKKLPPGGGYIFPPKQEPVIIEPPQDRRTTRVCKMNCVVRRESRDEGEVVRH